MKALAHITGGGFPDNIPRVLPDGICARIDLAAIPTLPVFRWLAQAGDIAEAEMLRTFNCGIGMIAVVAAGRGATPSRRCCTTPARARRHSARSCRASRRARRALSTASSTSESMAASAPPS